jgi:hypothetical protein
LRRKVATVELSALEAAMHRATAIHRFCADCKHNVITACDILAEKVDLIDVENNDEFNPELYRPFEGKVQEVAGKFVLECPLEDVEDLIAWCEGKLMLASYSFSLQVRGFRLQGVHE